MPVPRKILNRLLHMHHNADKYAVKFFHLKDVQCGQRELKIDKLLAMIKDEPKEVLPLPIVIRYDGVNWLCDGHHRAFWHDYYRHSFKALYHEQL